MVVGGPKQAIPLPDHVGHVMLTYHQGGRGEGEGGQPAHWPEY